MNSAFFVTGLSRKRNCEKIILSLIDLFLPSVGRVDCDGSAAWSLELDTRLLGRVAATTVMEAAFSKCACSIDDIYVEYAENIDY